MMTVPMRKGHLSQSADCGGAEAACGSFPQGGLSTQRAELGTKQAVRPSLPYASTRTYVWAYSWNLDTERFKTEICGKKIVLILETKGKLYKKKFH